jgi:hypothetical protein
MLGYAQPVAEVVAQAPFTPQQTPVKLFVQPAEAHVMPTPAKVPMVHPEKVTDVQVPLGAQHAPRYGVHGTGEQTVPKPR